MYCSVRAKKAGTSLGIFGERAGDECSLLCDLPVCCHRSSLDSVLAQVYCDGRFGQAVKYHPRLTDSVRLLTYWKSSAWTVKSQGLTLQVRSNVTQALRPTVVCAIPSGTDRPSLVIERHVTSI